MKSELCFGDSLVAAVEAKRSHVVVGLDPRFELIPTVIKREMRDKYGATERALCESIVAFNERIIDAVADIVPAVKPQIAFYERHALAGMEAFGRTIAYAKSRGLIVIADVKRMDIGSTMEAVSDAYLGRAPSWDPIGRTADKCDRQVRRRSLRRGHGARGHE